MANDLVIVLIPGGLGSKLSLSGTTVWNFDFSILPPNVSVDGIRMIIDPGLLLPWLPLEADGLLSVYKDLINFLESHGYRTDALPQSLYLFPFDWRQGMAANASLLAKMVNNDIVPNLAGRKILFISHSSGCMAVRWALLSFGAAGVPMIDPANVQMLVAAGPPMLGMASPFRDIVLMPSLDDTFDTLFGILQATYPSLADQVSIPINNCLMTVTAQLEGLPPDEIPILQGGFNPPLNQPYCALDWTGWPTSLSSLINSVRATQAALKTSALSVDCQVISSDQHDTDTGYRLGPNNEYLSSWKPDVGDGSVLLYSAMAYSTNRPLLNVGKKHRELLDDQKTRDFLASII
jgi:lecithin:cholesterol acyltransferase